MGAIRVSGQEDVEVLVRHSRRARRLSLRVSSIDGRVTLTVPRNVSERAARQFVQEKADWIGNAVSKCHAPMPVAIGRVLPIEGLDRLVVAGAGRSAEICGDRIKAPDGREGPAVEALIKHLARDRLSAAVEGYARKLDVKPGRLTLRDTRSRWGSCTSDGNLMFSWRLILAPRSILEYVAAHEVAHLLHMDHSPAFWNAVEELYPGYDIPRTWLRKHGVGLHRYRFREAD